MKKKKTFIFFSIFVFLMFLCNTYFFMNQLKESSKYDGEVLSVKVDEKCREDEKNSFYCTSRYHYDVNTTRYYCVQQYSSSSNDNQLNNDIIYYRTRKPDDCLVGKRYSRGLLTFMAIVEVIITVYLILGIYQLVSIHYLSKKKKTR